MQSFVPSSSEPLSVQQLQVELHVLSTKVEKLTKENADLRTYLRNSANESTLRRDYESIVVEKDRLVKLVEQLKNEKKNLVETVLQLSNEVDAVHKTSDQLEQDRQLYIQTDSIIRSARRKLGLQVLGVLESKGIGSDDPIMKEIRAVISNEELNSTVNDLAATTRHGIDVIGTDLDTKSSPYVPSSSLQRLDAASLQANDSAYRHQQQQQQQQQGLGTGHVMPSPQKGGLLYSTLSSRSRSVRSGSVKSRESRRRTQALERDETESVISSVSTHRSGRSQNSSSIKRKGQKSQITAENLALLNRLNGDDDGGNGIGGGGDKDGGGGAATNGAKTRPSDRGLTPNTSRKTKTTEEAPAASWWPKLF